mgnify:CR=1 FL=1
MAETGLVLKETLITQPTTGIAFEVKRGQVIRLVLVADLRAFDFDVFNSDNLKERFSSSVTRSNEGAHLTKGHTLTSIPPYLNPMFTITDDAVAHKPNPKGAISHTCCSAGATDGFAKRHKTLIRTGARRTLRVSSPNIVLSRRTCTTF